MRKRKKQVTQPMMAHPKRYELNRSRPRKSLSGSLTPLSIIKTTTIRLVLHLEVAFEYVTLFPALNMGECEWMEEIFVQLSE